MKNKLSWEEISKQYNQEWVELIDYDWPEGQPHPYAGIVRAHGGERKEFYKSCKARDTQDGESPNDAAIVFVGKIRSTAHAYLSTSLVRMVS